MSETRERREGEYELSRTFEELTNASDDDSVSAEHP